MIHDRDLNINVNKDDSYIKAHFCQVSLVQAARWKGIFDLEDRVRKPEGRYFNQRFTRSNICKDEEVPMRLVRLQMRGSVFTSSVLSGDVMVRNGIFWTIGGKLYIVYYPIIYYQNIKVYRVETMDMGRYHWNNGVIGIFCISINTTVLIVRDKILW